MADYTAAGTDTSVVDDNVPPGITGKQDEIIQYVAKYVVASCDGARYQDKVRTRTKHNPYFDFLNTKHPYHPYYQYLLESYRHWMRNSEAVGMGTWGGGGSGVDGMQEQGQQQQWGEEEYDQYYGAYTGQANGIDYQGGAGGHLNQGSGYVDTTRSAHAQNASSGVDPTAYVSETATATSYSVGYDPSAVGPEPVQAATSTGDGEAQAEEDEDDQYELVMENGQWVSRKRV
ncbi:hypothetical protein LSCM1_06307 [Leishmania martiniquensis]|uniref:SURP motif domain-containing protein n=1 Tax=Leishmania martiniquensis TaxID=1580590 RepID=A0A836HFY2_9TRYP|nr:hypothetical protein LSCM1_06307 [Leishmania martiniquensis]